MNICTSATAGSLESSDVLITISPKSEPGIDLNIESIVMKQFGARIRTVTEEIVAKLNLDRAIIHVQDRGALECTLRARLETVIGRSTAQ